jgi:hypothetical protein
MDACWPDGLRGRFAVEQLAADHAALVARIPKDAGRNGIAAMGGHQGRGADPDAPRHGRPGP